jgi:hypothetical protein
MSGLLLVIQLGYVNGDIQVCRALRQAFYDWYIATAGQDALGKLKSGKWWRSCPSDKRLQHYAMQNQDSQLLRAACPPLWTKHRGALMQLKERVADDGDVDALRWLFAQQQGITSVALQRAVERNDLRIVQLIAEHVKNTNQGEDFGSCMRQIGRYGANTNQWNYVKWMLDAGESDMDIVLKAARAGHADLLERYLACAGPQNVCTQKLACYYSRQHLSLQSLLRALGWPCDCAHLATVLTKRVL